VTVFQPADAAEAADHIAAAAAARQPLELLSGGSKRGLGRPPQATHQLDASRLSGVIDYDPAELQLTAHAATPMAQIEALLADQHQMLAFEPPDWRALLGSAGTPTLAGVIACNLAGPRRVRAGAARDHILGFNAVNGLGEPWKSGGKVVKNVTGYDLSKLQCGAYGTLSLLTRITVKVMPRPETACSLLFIGLPDEAAIALLAQALNTPWEVSAAAHLPALAAGRSQLTAVRAARAAMTVLRLEGPAPSVRSRATALQAQLGGGELLAADDSRLLWSEIGTVRQLLADGQRCVWRLCPTPSAAPALLQLLRARLPSSDGFYDWGGGLLWLSIDANEAGADGAAGIVRMAMQPAGGHATLVLASDVVRAATPVFEPMPSALAALNQRVKHSFDPHGILNPGRMQECR
jgi:glycolate oxidase FAD binding subunit